MKKVKAESSLSDKIKFNGTLFYFFLINIMEF